MVLIVLAEHGFNPVSFNGSDYTLAMSDAGILTMKWPTPVGQFYIAAPIINQGLKTVDVNEMAIGTEHVRLKINEDFAPTDDERHVLVTMLLIFANEFIKGM